MWRVKGLVAVGLAVVLAGCASGSSHNPLASTTPVDVSKLDVGGYKTTPVTVGKLTLEQARLAEGERLANYLPLPMDIDPRFKYQTGNSRVGQFGFTEDAESTGLFVDNLDTQTPGFIAGFNVDSQSDRQLEISIHSHYSVLIFRDPASATAACKILHDLQFAHNADFAPVSIDGHPDTLAFWQPGTNGLQTFTATGTYVLYTKVVDQAMAEVNLTDLPDLTNLSKKVLETVPPALNSFHPTPSDQLTGMRLDKDGMISRSLFQATHTGYTTPPEIYDQHGAVLLSESPAADQELYSRTGMDLMVKNASTLYRTKDDRAASELLDNRSAIRRFYETATPPNNLPDARCIERKDGSMNVGTNVPRYYCAVTYGRYVAEVQSEQLIDVHQRISAQYTLLAKQ